MMATKVNKLIFIRQIFIRQMSLNCFVRCCHNCIRRTSWINYEGLETDFIREIS